jgi:Tfp pilus assembly major pilin PilA
MQEKKVAGFFLEIFMVVAVLGTLSAIAIPRVGQMMAKTDTVAQKSELHIIQVAVIEMLCDSSARTLEPVGPTADMGEVLTTDTPPLVLADYLITDGGSLSLGCNYTFDANGKVTQIIH